MNCPSCSGGTHYIEEHSRWYCYACEEYLPEGLPGPEEVQAPSAVFVINSRKVKQGLGMIFLGLFIFLTTITDTFIILEFFIIEMVLVLIAIIMGIIQFLPMDVTVDAEGISVDNFRLSTRSGRWSFPWNTITMIETKGGTQKTMTITTTTESYLIKENDLNPEDIKRLAHFIRWNYLGYYKHIQFHDRAGLGN